MRPAGESLLLRTHAEERFYFLTFFSMANPSPTAQRPAVTDATSPAQASKKPLATFRFEAVSAAVYTDEVKTAKGSFPVLNVSLRRSYRGEDGEWHHLHTLRAGDLLPAALALLKAYEFAADAQAPEASDK
jgi:hypothetical protein